MKKFTVIDLFAGAGGLSTGFQQAGFEIIGANEINPVFAETYKNNHKKTKIFTDDIRNISVEEIKKQCNITQNQIDVVIGGPPCQGFSMAGRRDPKDPRNSLFMEFIRIVNGLKPKFFVMENVPGIMTMKTLKGDFVHKIIFNEFEKMGYKVKAQILHAADYGVPQKRKRVVFIGTNTDKAIRFPEQTHSKEPKMRLDGTKIKKWIPVSSILLPKEKVNKSFFHSEKMIKGFETRKKRNEENGKGFGAQYLKIDEPSYTISARYWKDGSDALVKYSDKEIRMLTPEEVAAIQTFPKDYIFNGSKRYIYTQIGNAVPCILGKAIAQEIKRYLT